MAEAKLTLLLLAFPESLFWIIIIMVYNHLGTTFGIKQLYHANFWKIWLIQQHST